MGGTGDDRLEIELTTALTDRFASADGGSGDDMFSVNTDIGDGTTGVVSSVELTGGEGADTFEVILNLVDYTFDPEVPEGVVDGNPGITLHDFNPGEDMLSIQIDRADGGEDRDMGDAQIVTDALGRSTLVMSFAATAT
ncbi:hypothetical protein O4H61_17415 [Roseovarius aestuarii]|nr:hypothetical protein [Roseovarius aestuarii]